MHRFLLTLAALVTALTAAFLAPAAHAQSFSDTFDDSAPSSYWQAVEAVDAVSIAEVGGTPVMLKLPLAQAADVTNGAAVTLAVDPVHCRALDPRA